MGIGQVADARPPQNVRKFLHSMCASQKNNLKGFFRSRVRIPARGAFFLLFSPQSLLEDLHRCLQARSFLPSCRRTRATACNDANGNTMADQSEANVVWNQGMTLAWSMPKQVASEMQTPLLSRVRHHTGSTTSWRLAASLATTANWLPEKELFFNIQEITQYNSRALSTLVH